MLHSLHNFNFKLSITNHILINKNIFLQHLNSIVLISLRHFTKENCSKGSLSNDGQKFQVIEVHRKGFVLCLIGELLDDEDVERPVICHVLLFI